MKKLFWLILLLASPAWATTRYISTTGSDSNSCAASTSVSTPKRNFNGGSGALACMASGDTLIVRGGSYFERLISSSGVFIPSGINAGSPTIIQAFTGETVWIRTPDGVAGETFGIFVSGTSSFITFDGIRVDNIDTGAATDPSSDCVKIEQQTSSSTSPPQGIIYKNGEVMNCTMGILMGGYQNQILNNKIHNIILATNADPLGAYGIYLGGNGNIIDGNEIYDYPSIGIHQYSQTVPTQDLVMRNNYIHDVNYTIGSGPNGILMGRGTNQQAYNNLIVRAGFGIFSGYFGSNHLIANNTIAENDDTAHSPFSNCIGYEDVATISIRNNICFNNLQNGIVAHNSNVSGLTLDHNICSGCDVAGTPTFVNAAGDNYHSTIGSPAINSGVSLSSTFTTDRDGILRPQGAAWDLGAYEFNVQSEPIFAYYSPYVIDHTKVPSTQSNFPVLVSVTANRFRSVGNGGHIVNGSGGIPSDLRVYSNTACNAPLDYQIQRYNATTGELILRTRIPSLSSSVDTTIYICYGNAAVTTDASTPNVWDSNYKGVWPLGNGAILSAADRTSNGVNGTLINAPTATAGKVDGAANFVSSSTQYINFGSSAFNTQSAITMEGWLNGTSFPNSYNSVLNRASSTIGTYTQFFVKSNGKLAMFVVNTTQSAYDGTGSTTLSTGTWYHVVLTYDSSSGLKGYVNASVDGTAAADGALRMDPLEFRIASDPALLSREFNGIIDEVKISDVVRSADWITTTYNNEGNSATFGALGSEVPDTTIHTVMRRINSMIGGRSNSRQARK